MELLREAEVVVTEVPGHAELVCTLLGDEVFRGEDGPLIVDGGFGEDGQPLTHAARAKVVVREAKKGRRVVRLMAGDPFLYASGPEEAQACVKAGLGFEIVPGVSSVSAVPAYAGIPLTSKDNREVARRAAARTRSTGATTPTPARSCCSPPWAPSPRRPRR